MANDNGNPIIGDTVGNLVEKEVKITGIRVIASGDTWSCTLTDANDRKVFKSSSDVANKRGDSWTPAQPFKVNGLKIAALTDISEIYVYTTTSRLANY